MQKDTPANYNHTPIKLAKIKMWKSLILAWYKALFAKLQTGIHYDSVISLLGKHTIENTDM